MSGSSETSPGSASILTRGFISLRVAALASATLQHTALSGPHQNLPRRKSVSGSFETSSGSASISTRGFVSLSVAALASATLQHTPLIINCMPDYSYKPEHRQTACMPDCSGKLEHSCMTALEHCCRSNGRGRCGVKLYGDPLIH